MRRKKFWLSFTVLLVLSLTGTAWAQLDVAAPFLNQEVGDYYIKARVLQPAGQRCGRPLFKPGGGRLLH